MRSDHFFRTRFSYKKLIPTRMSYRSHWSTIFIPRLIPATSDGIVWEKAKGWETDWQIEEELTDEEDMSEDEIMATTTATSSAVH